MIDYLLPLLNLNQRPSDSQTRFGSFPTVCNQLQLSPKQIISRELWFCLVNLFSDVFEKHVSKHVSNFEILFMKKYRVSAKTLPDVINAIPFIYF
jgi:hypothetical protein